MLQLHEFFFRLSNSVYYFQCIIKISVLFSLTFFFVILFRIFIFFMYVLRMRINFGSFAIFTLYSSTSLVRSRKYIRAHWGVLRTFFLTRSLSHVLSLSLALCVCACERYSFDSLAYSLSLSRSLYARLCVMRSLWACAIHPSIHMYGFIRLQYDTSECWFSDSVFQMVRIFIESRQLTECEWMRIFGGPMPPII